jgi:hypothetical protein
MTVLNNYIAKGFELNFRINNFKLWVPDLLEWKGESRIQVNSPDSRSDPRREAISSGI